MPDSFRLAAASAVAAALFATISPAVSADLYAPRYGSAYDEPRYGDAYGETYRESSTYDRYAEPQDDFDPPYRPRTSYKDESLDHESFKEEIFADYYGRSGRYAERGEHCVPRHIARARLRDEGWRQFRNFEPQGRVVLAQARGPSGGLFDLTIDRCSGEILAARKLYDGRAFAGDSRRYWQRY
jgi:hypothetical protein